MTPDDPVDRHADPANDRETARQPRRRGGWLLGLGMLFLLIGALAIGAQGYYARNQEVAATVEQLRDFAPQVRVAAVTARCTIVVSMSR